jgi:3-hydroxyacyl-CoA dehydrogenase
MIHKVGVLGCGLMGSGIAQVCDGSVLSKLKLAY